MSTMKWTCLQVNTILSLIVFLIVGITIVTGSLMWVLHWSDLPHVHSRMTNMERFHLVTKNQLNPEQRQLFDLVLAAGITIHPKIFKWVINYCLMEIT